MKAVYFKKTGDAADVLIFGERDLPSLGEGDVMVRLHASGVNPSDVKKRAGYQAPGFVDGFVIPHSDGAGVIEAVGRSVAKDRVGERVWVYQAQFARHMGTAAEYVVVPSDRACYLPDNTGFEVGACLGIPVMTAHRCVNLQGGVEGSTVLVTGASGRVGYYAVQWAKLAGAVVIGTAGSPQRVEIARDSGADLVLDYNSENVLEAVMEFTGGRGLDRIIDVEFGINIHDSAEMLKVNGVLASYSSSKMPEPVIPFYPMMFKNISMRTVLVYNMPENAKQSAMVDITKALENAELKHRVAHQFTLENTANAHLAIEKGSLDGCVVVSCS